MKIRGRLTGFNPRTPCGVRLMISVNFSMSRRFQSTHSLRSATLLNKMKKNTYVSFNPRTPCGVRLNKLNEFWVLRRVSIHALLAECDWASKVIPQRLKMFQSTHSLRSATQPTLYITTQQSKSYFAPTSLKRPSLHGYTF